MDRQIVAAVLPFEAHLMTQPPHGGVKEQHRLNDPLQQVRPMVVPPDVGQIHAIATTQPAPGSGRLGSLLAIRLLV